jgi:hypothetical protein
MGANDRCAQDGSALKRIAVSIRTPSASTAHRGEETAFRDNRTSIQRSAGRPFTVVTAASMVASLRASSPQSVLPSDLSSAAQEASQRSMVSVGRIR